MCVASLGQKDGIGQRTSDSWLAWLLLGVLGRENE
jgi:hypothetical protein